MIYLIVMAVGLLMLLVNRIAVQRTPINTNIPANRQRWSEADYLYPERNISHNLTPEQARKIMQDDVARFMAEKSEYQMETDRLLANARGRLGLPKND